MIFNDREVGMLESAVRTWITVAQTSLSESDNEEEIAEITNDLTAMEILLSRISSSHQSNS